jgi:carbamoyltransferase
VGWFDGRMEFGPRALGSRSILGDPRSPRMQAEMNLKIKFREGFRPFAPSVLQERVGEYFELDRESPYMLLVAPVRKERQIPMTDAERRLWGIDQLNVVRSDIPAVTHIDYSARIQTVSRDTNPNYYDLIREFDRLTGCPVLVNTSFNVRGEPIVCTPADAYRCFMRTQLDYLVLWPFLLDKSAQPAWQETVDWRREFQLD